VLVYVIVYEWLLPDSFVRGTAKRDLPGE